MTVSMDQSVEKLCALGAGARAEVAPRAKVNAVCRQQILLTAPASITEGWLKCGEE